VLTCTGITTTGSGALNVSDNDVIVDFSGASPLASITTQVGGGYAFGAWTGAGIRSSSAALTGGLTAIGIAETSQVFGLSGAQTTNWNGVTVDATCVLLKYTYAGDANIDGVVDAGDYGLIDNDCPIAGAHGWFNGDFNYDGVIDATDYGAIDNAHQLQGAAL
jgi:hypothetical protein